MSFSRMILQALIALVFAGIAAGLMPSDALRSLLAQAAIYAVFALGVGLLLRQNGMVSFGHALYFGLAAYVVAILLHQRWASAEAAIAVAVCVSTVCALFIGTVIGRAPGIAFSMLTLAIGQMAYLTTVRAGAFTGGADGLTIEWPSTLFGLPSSAVLRPQFMLMLSFGVLVVLLLGLAIILRGRFGAVTEAVRDNEERARFIGIRTWLPRVAIYTLSAMVVSIAGVLSALNTSFVSPESMHWSLSGVALMMVVVGGTRVLWGPSLGAAAYFFAKEMLGEQSQHWMALFGVALIVIVVFAPEGLSGLLLRLSRGRLRRRMARASGAIQRDRQVCNG